MFVTPVNFSSNNVHKKKIKFNPLRDTGYAAIALGVGSAIAGGKKKIKLHKYLAVLSGIAALAHVGIIQYYKRVKIQK